MTSLLLVVSLLVQSVSSFSSGAGGCAGGTAAVGGAHLSRDSVVRGPLSDGNLQVSLDGVPLIAGTTTDLTTGEDHTLTLSGSFRGFLFRLEGSSVDTTAALSSADSLGQVATACTVLQEVGGVTHTNSNVKTSFSAVLRIDDPDSLSLDVTSVSENRGSSSVYYYSPFDLNAVPPPAPTDPPATLTSSPTAAVTPAAEPTDPPTTAPPVPRPTSPPTTVQPVARPTNPPTTSPPVERPTTVPATSPPVARPTMAPTAASPVARPTMAPSDSPGATRGPTAAPTDFSTNTLFDVLLGEGNLTTLLAAVDGTEISGLLASPDFNLTLFAPENDAFSLLPLEYAYYFNESYWFHMTALLLNHAVEGEVLNAADIFDGRTAEILSELGISLPVSQANMTVGGASVVEADLEASNGVMHIVDKVLVPEPLQATLSTGIPNSPFNVENFTSLVLAANETITYMLDTFLPNGLTAVVPLDQAFDNSTLAFLLLPWNIETLTVILAYHIFIDSNIYLETLVEEREIIATSSLGVSAWVTVDSDDNTIRFNGAEVVSGDGLSGNGVAHFTSSFLLPPDISTSLAIADEYSNFIDLFDIQDLASSAGITFSNIPGYNNTALTLLAPTDDAFDDTFDRDDYFRLQQPIWIRHLQKFVLHFVVEGAIDGETALSLVPVNLTTLSGSTIEVTSDADGSVFVDGFFVSTGDVFATDGVIHFLDGVIQPPAVSDSIWAQIQADPNLSSLAEAVETAGLNVALEEIPDNGLTLLAPDNAAFNAFGPIEDLTDLLLSHVFTAIWFTDALADLVQGGPVIVTSANGTPWPVTVNELTGDVFVGDARIAIGSDTFARNGVIQKIDVVLREPAPPTSSAFPSAMPSAMPSASPSAVPSRVPSSMPSAAPVPPPTNPPTLPPAQATPTDPPTSGSVTSGSGLVNACLCMFFISQWFGLF